MLLGMVGLGRMGMNMTRRLLQDGHQVVVYNRTLEKVYQMQREGAIAAESPEDLVNKLDQRRIVWLMLPAGKVTDEYINIFGDLLGQDDIIIEGGNAYYQDDIRRYEVLKQKGIAYLDAGVSGGIWGLENGYSLMVGGDRDIYEYTESLFRSLAPPEGCLYCGASGAGHFVKMLHNGIEYAMMEALAEGFDVLKASRYGDDIDLKGVAHVWNRGSVIRSWLLELLESVFSEDAGLASIKGYVPDSGETRWTVKEAVDIGVAADVIAASLFKRFNSRQKDVFANKIVAALRNKFGGHSLAKAGENLRTNKAGAGKISHAQAEE